MINRLFIISNLLPTSHRVAPEEGIHHSTLAAFPLKDSLSDIYRQATSGSVNEELILTLDVKEELTEELLESLAAFLFLPQYLRLEGRPVLNILEHEPGTIAHLSEYLSAQGITQPLVYRIASQTGIGGTSDTQEPVFRSAEELASHYRDRLQNETGLSRPLFFWGTDTELAVTSLRSVESSVNRESPLAYALMQREALLVQELRQLKKEYVSMADELRYQLEYNEILRAGNEAKQIQDYYTQEYETLPLWFKRLGHIVKVLAGKRTFRSLFRDDVKKYKD